VVEVQHDRLLPAVGVLQLGELGCLAGDDVLQGDAVAGEPLGVLLGGDVAGVGVVELVAQLVGVVVELGDAG
jgi:hypothetical protein